MKKILLLLIITLPQFFFTQDLESLKTDKKDVSFRGLSAVNDSIVWISGNNGTIGKSTNGGETFNWVSPPQYKNRDFRDIEAFNDSVAIIMAIDTPGIILKTTNGGKSWKEVYRDNAEGVFMDAMYFSDEKNGILIGDPIDKFPYFLTSSDTGSTWNKFNKKQATKTLPILNFGEYFFASSGTNLLISRNTIFFVTGGIKSNLYSLTQNKINRKEIPIAQGKETLGANSLDFKIFKNNANFGVIVGGDFNNPTKSKGNCMLFTYGVKGLEFNESQTPPKGYKSCVQIIDEKRVISCGPTGVDISTDQGNNWSRISKEAFHTCLKAKNSTTVFLTGANGNFAKISLEEIRETEEDGDNNN